MVSDLWKACLACEDKCCKQLIASVVFLTKEEKKKFPRLYDGRDCEYFNEKGLCNVHEEKPVDCKLFPFDMRRIGEKFYWIVWQINCPIVLNNGKREFESYLQEHEKNIIPGFKKYISEYSDFLEKELFERYEFEVLREVRF